MIAQPIQVFENLTSETTPAGGNALAKIGFSHDDRRWVELEARYARAAVMADMIGDAFLWAQGLFNRLTAGLKAGFRVRAAEAQLFRMSDRELSDLGLCRSDIPFAVREAAAVQAAGEAPHFETTDVPAAANQNNGPAIFWAGRA